MIRIAKTAWVAALGLILPAMAFLRAGLLEGYVRTPDTRFNCKRCDQKALKEAGQDVQCFIISGPSNRGGRISVLSDIRRLVVPGIYQKRWRATALQRRRHSSGTTRLIWTAAALCRFSPSIQCGAGNSEMRPTVAGPHNSP